MRDRDHGSTASPDDDSLDAITIVHWVVLAVPLCVGLFTVLSAASAWCMAKAQRANLPRRDRAGRVGTEDDEDDSSSWSSLVSDLSFLPPAGEESNAEPPQLQRDDEPGAQGSTTNQSAAVASSNQEPKADENPSARGPSTSLEHARVAAKPRGMPDAAAPHRGRRWSDSSLASSGTLFEAPAAQRSAPRRRQSAAARTMQRRASGTSRPSLDSEDGGDGQLPERRRSSTLSRADVKTLVASASPDARRKSKNHSKHKRHSGHRRRQQKTRKKHLPKVSSMLRLKEAIAAHTARQKNMPVVSQHGLGLEQQLSAATSPAPSRRRRGKKKKRGKRRKKSTEERRSRRRKGSHHHDSDDEINDGAHDEL